MTTAIALIAKSPVPGRVKTRMQPPLTAVEAADLAGRLLLDSHAQAAATGADLWCSYDGPQAPLSALLPRTTPLIAQRGGDLAVRLANVQADLFAAGYRAVLLLGGDCPTVGAGTLRRALELVGDNAVALGPARDGGYTFLAAAHPTPHLFSRMVMSTERVLADTLERASLCGTAVTLTLPRHDLDTAADLVDALDAGELAEAPRTRAVAETVRQLRVAQRR